ncbi:hypothetical protein H0H92_008856 [Tricholoma furcatifolium]|nr:hypothetical protein H0H92_008856 [Tricholoma furcatifolium]
MSEHKYTTRSSYLAFRLKTILHALLYLGPPLSLQSSSVVWANYLSTKRSFSQHTSRVLSMTMIVFSVTMFFLATWHMIMNCIRLLAGYVDHATTPGGPAAYIGNLRPWDHILKDTLYATQENLGSAAAIYRCWILWNRDWRVTVLPIALLLANCVAGYTVCATYSSVDPTETVFSSRLDHWIKTFYSIAVILNIITTSLMAYRIWNAHRRSAAYVQGRGNLLPILQILVESAALQLVVEIVLLALYCSDINAQYIVLESVASVVVRVYEPWLRLTVSLYLISRKGITFNLITLRIRFHAMESASQPGSVAHPVQTIGSLPMRRIHVNISQDVEDHTDSDLAAAKLSRA